MFLSQHLLSLLLNLRLQAKYPSYECSNLLWQIDETPSSYKFDLDKRDSLESFIARVSQVFDKSMLREGKVKRK
jgi:hypothetical protein